MKPFDILKGSTNLKIKKIKKNIIVCYLLDDKFNRVCDINQKGLFYQKRIIRKCNLKNYKLIKTKFLPF